VQKQVPIDDRSREQIQKALAIEVVAVEPIARSLPRLVTCQMAPRNSRRS
jgi:hypothetical protein